MPNIDKPHFLTDNYQSTDSRDFTSDAIHAGYYGTSSAVPIYQGNTNDGIVEGKILLLSNEEGEPVAYLGTDDDSDGLLMVKSKTGTNLIYAGASTSDNGFLIAGYNKTGERVVQLRADEYGNGVVGAYNRKGMGKTLKPGP